MSFGDIEWSQSWRTLLKQALKGQKSEDEQDLSQDPETCCNVACLLLVLLLFLQDRIYVQQNGVDNVYDMGLMLFRDHVSGC